MTKIERTIYNAAIWLYCATSGRNAYRWPTKYGRPIGSAVMRTMVRRSQVRRAFAESGLIDGLDTVTTKKGRNMTLDEIRNDYDWQEAFVYGTNIRTATGCNADGFGISDVSEVLKESPGENDEQSWMIAGKLNDGRFFFLDALCDYTGWDCRAGGDSQVADTLENLVRFGMTEEARARLGFEVSNANITGG